MSSDHSQREDPGDYLSSSEEEDTELYESYQSTKPNKVDCGVQTSASHFNKVKQTEAYKSDQEDKAYSTDWELSGIYDDLKFKKATTAAAQTETDDFGNQVEEKQIV